MAGKIKKTDPDIVAVKLAQGGNLIGLRSLYEKYFPAIYRFCFWQTGREDDAEDLTQETFLAMTKSLPKFRGEAQFKNWLYQIAKNLVAQWIKKKKNTVSFSLPALEELADEPQWIDPDNEVYKKKVVTKLLSDLKPEEKKILHYRYLLGYSVLEVAKKFSFTESNVKVITHRALKKIQRKFPNIPKV